MYPEDRYWPYNPSTIYVEDKSPKQVNPMDLNWLFLGAGLAFFAFALTHSQFIGVSNGPFTFLFTNPFQ